LSPEAYGANGLRLIGLGDLIYVAKTLARVRYAELSSRDIDDFYKITRTLVLKQGSTPLFSSQKRNEILAFLSRLKRTTVRAACEIGTGHGGTTYLLTKVLQPDVSLITIDPKNDWRKKIILSSLKKPRQRLHVISAYSTHPGTFSRVAGILRDQKLDLLFIDADHSYPSVKQDFEIFSKLVREGGWIAFHDIVPDYYSRFGVRTISSSGDVPKYWRELRGKWSSTEIVENWDQDGYGLGVLEWRSAAV
jgi:hypothetical protein